MKNSYLLVVSLSLMMGFVFLNCTLFQKSTKKNAKVYESNGLVDFNLTYGPNQISAFINSLSKTPADTCVVYVDMTFYQNLSIRYDSVSYICFGGRTLKKKSVDAFQKQFKPYVSRKPKPIISFEPYSASLQFTVQFTDKEEPRYLLGFHRMGIPSKSN